MAIATRQPDVASPRLPSQAVKHHKRVGQRAAMYKSTFVPCQIVHCFNGCSFSFLANVYSTRNSVLSIDIDFVESIHRAFQACVSALLRSSEKLLHLQTEKIRY
jgi:hypothetical protein